MIEGSSCMITPYRLGIFWTRKLFVRLLTWHFEIRICYVLVKVVICFLFFIFLTQFIYFISVIKKFSLILIHKSHIKARINLNEKLNLSLFYVSSFTASYHQEKSTTSPTMTESSPRKKWTIATTATKKS